MHTGQESLLLTQDYGLASGMFSLGYGIAHLPSTFLTMRLGARWWYSSITIAWGILATCGAFIVDRTSLCIQRFLLGVAEAGNNVITLVHHIDSCLLYCVCVS